MRFAGFISMHKELKQALGGHGLFLVGLFLFTLLNTHPPFRYQKIITVNLTNLKGQGEAPGPALPTAPKAVQPAAKPLAPPKPKIEKAIQTPVPPKVQKVTPKPSVQTPVKKSAPPTPSLSERLKNRLSEVNPVRSKPPQAAAAVPLGAGRTSNGVKRPESTKKFVEPGQTPPSAASKYRFVEPEAWQSMRAGSGSGTAMAAGGPGGETFPHAWYLALIQNKITLNWKEPAKQMIEQANASAIVSFVITREGSIEKIRLSSSSGMSLLDQSALEAVKSSHPLPPLPDNYPEGTLQVRIKFGLTE